MYSAHLINAPRRLLKQLLQHHSAVYRCTVMARNLAAYGASTITTRFFTSSAAMTDGGTGTCRPHEGCPQGKDTGRDERFDDLFHSSTLVFGEKTRDAEDHRATPSGASSKTDMMIGSFTDGP